MPSRQKPTPPARPARKPARKAGDLPLRKDRATDVKGGYADTEANSEKIKR